MADLEEVVRELKAKYDELNEKVRDIEINTTRYLSDIKIALAEIKGLVEKDKEVGNKDNDIIMAKVKDNSERLDRIEGIISKITWIIVI